MDQPKFKFGEEVEYGGNKFVVGEIRYIDTYIGRPTGYYYHNLGINHHEGALKYPKKDIKPINQQDLYDELYRSTLDCKNLTGPEFNEIYKKMRQYLADEGLLE